MGIGFSCLLLVLGVLGAANLIIAKKPEAKEIIAKISPYQGWIGVVAAISGLVWLIHVILNIGGWLKTIPVLTILFLAGSVVCVCLGALFGVGIFNTFIKNDEAKAKLAEFVAKVAPYQGTLGIVAIGVAIGSLVMDIIS